MSGFLLSGALTRREMLAAAGAITLTARMSSAHATEERSLDASTLKTVTTDVKGPEGASLLPDGSVAMVEFVVGNIIRVYPDGRRNVLVSPGPGVVGTALGRDGALYAVKLDPGKFGPPGQNTPKNDSPGGVLRVDLKTQQSTMLYTQFEGQELKGPDDIVVDANGDLWFTDVVDKCVYWGKPDGSQIKRVLSDSPGVNGICLSPDHKQMYVIANGKLVAYTISGRGELRQKDGVPQGRELLTLPQGRQPDGMRTEAGGNIVGGCWEDGIAVYSVRGDILERVRIPGVRVISLCFGGADLRTIYLAALPKEGMSGMLLQMPWPRAGMRLPV